MQLNKNDYHILKYIGFYKWFSIVFLALGVILTGLHLYSRTFSSTQNQYLNNALIAASICVAMLSFLMYSFVKLSEKLSSEERKGMKTQRGQSESAG